MKFFTFTVRCLAVFTVLLLSSCKIAGAAGQAVLVQQHEPRSIILLSTDAASDEVLAANELRQYVKKITDTELEVRQVAPGLVGAAAQQISEHARLPILLGQAALTGNTQNRLRATGGDSASFVLSVDTGAIRVAGVGAEGTLFGVYELLEQLGVRWFMPGELGTVVPKQKSLMLPLQQTVQSPSFAGRWHGGSENKEWARRLRMGGPYFPSAHGIPGTSKADFAAHPEYFALVGGKRVAGQLCVSNPDVQRLAIEAAKAYFAKNPTIPWMGMGPEDASGFCECPNCRALDGGDWDAFSNEPSMTDRYIWFFNKVLEGIQQDFPAKKICFYSYHTYMRPPVRIKPNPLVVPALAPIALCRVHGMSNPVCPERSYYAFLMQAWGKISPEVYERGYWFNLADPGLPFSQVHKVRDEIPVGHRLGMKGWRVETVNHWGSETPSLYIAAKLMWNHEANVDALLSDFYQKFFGPAEKPMAAYFTLMDTALRDADHHTGSSFDAPLLYPSALRKQARSYLHEARRLGGKGPYGERVRLFQTSFNYLEAFINMQQHSAALDFAASYCDLSRVQGLQKELLAYDPPMINPRLAVTYFKRFFQQPIEQGYARTTKGNELVAKFKDEWDFQIDPQKVGEDIGLWKDTVKGGNWRPLKTSSLSWSEQGLRTYKGEVWYRQSVTIPARFSGKRVFLWFGGIDEKAKVWVNGQQIGISPRAAFLPFELDATKAIKPGALNTVSVRLINETVDELGTGGITAPVMFYSPAQGFAAQIDNPNESARTFP